MILFFKLWEATFDEILVLDAIDIAVLLPVIPFLFLPLLPVITDPWVLTTADDLYV